jgi:hypothetical protein
LYFGKAIKGVNPLVVSRQGFVFSDLDGDLKKSQNQ